MGLRAHLERHGGCQGWLHCGVPPTLAPIPPSWHSLVQALSAGSVSARKKPLRHMQTVAAPEVVRLLGGQGEQGPSPCLDLNVPGPHAGGRENEPALMKGTQQCSIDSPLPTPRPRLRSWRHRSGEDVLSPFPTGGLRRPEVPTPPRISHPGHLNHFSACGGGTSALAPALCAEPDYNIPAPASDAHWRSPGAGPARTAGARP